MPSITTQDLRSEAKDFGRIKASKAKWSRGARSAAGKWGCTPGSLQCFSGCPNCYKRPQREEGRGSIALRQSMQRKETAQNNSMIKKAFRGTVVEAIDDAHDGLSDSSGDVDVHEASAAPELNEVMYSYDAPTGPTRGNDILSYAINQAVQRYENNETDKIVNKEYDLVLDGKDEPESFVADADDDFELIDGSHFK